MYMEFKQTFNLIVNWKLFQKTKVLSDKIEATLREWLKNYEMKKRYDQFSKRGNIT